MNELACKLCSNNSHYRSITAKKKKHTCNIILNMQSGFLSYIDQLRFKGF